MKLSEVQTIAETKGRYDLRVKELDQLINRFYGLVITVGEGATQIQLTAGKYHPMNDVYRQALVLVLNKEIEELKTKLMMFGVTDFNS